MRSGDLDALLRELPKATPAQLKRLQRACVVATEQPWFNQQWYARLRGAYATRGLQPPPWTQRALDLGEAWLLLYEGSTGVGTVATLRARLDAPQSGTLWGADAQDEARLALGGLVAALAKRGRCLPQPVFRYHLSAEAPVEGAAIAGGSLGAAVCAAVTSAALTVPIRPNVAASACVRPDGSLSGVAFLGDKLAALRLQQPAVDTVIVARGQQGVNVEGIHLVQCTHVVDGLEQFGLDIDALPRTDLATCRKRVRQFDVDEEETTSANRWGELAADALFAYRVLSHAGKGYEDESAKALAWWILFSAHAGHSGDLSGLRDEVKQLQSCVSPTQHALVQVFLASWQIDENPEGAVTTSHQALTQARALSYPDQVLRRALGTHGRALMHSGDAAAAVLVLQQSVAEHERSEPHEVPRSLTYLASAQRLAGDAALGLESAEAGLRQLEAGGRHEWSEKTRCYLELERGRCLLALGRALDALAAFDVAARACEFDHEHPRSAALRGLAHAHRLLGNHRLAEDYYGRCTTVAADTAHPPILRKVAAMAIADKCASAELDSQEKTIWSELFGGTAERDTVLSLRARWVY